MPSAPAGDDLRPYFRNPGPKAPATGMKAAASSGSAVVTETMLKVLKAGGRAADAAIAGALVQGAVEPHLTNHAGLVTLLYYEAATGIVHQLDSLGTHPAGLAPFRPIPPGAGPFAATPPSAIIPGYMPGLKAFHERFGSRPWRELCEPAIEWAERGRPVSTFEYGVNIFAEKFITYFPEGRAFWKPDGWFPNAGELAIAPGLAQTLRGVAKHGPDYMITGPWAEAFVAKANAMGWPITLDHMTETGPRWMNPCRFRHRDYEILSLSVPQAQGLFTGVVLGVLKHLGVTEMTPGSADHLWAVGSALRQGVRHWEYAQDETIWGVPQDEVLDDAYHAHLARMIHKGRPKVDLTEHLRLSGMVGEGGLVPTAADPSAAQPAGSCEIAVADEAGNWVQLMNTMQGSGIPGQVVGGVPMIGSHATFGHLTSPMDATLLKGAKGRSIIGNTMVLKDGRPVMSAGTPGNVHCTVPQVLSYLLDFEMAPQDAIDAIRMLPMTENRSIVVEDRLPQGTLEGLHRLGVRVGVMGQYEFHMGSFAVIVRNDDDGRYTALTDPRRCGLAGGLT